MSIACHQNCTKMFTAVCLNFVRYLSVVLVKTYGFL